MVLSELQKTCKSAENMGLSMVRAPPARKPILATVRNFIVETMLLAHSSVCTPRLGLKPEKELCATPSDVAVCKKSRTIRKHRIELQRICFDLL